MLFFTHNWAYSFLSRLLKFVKLDRNRVSLTSFAVAMATNVDSVAIWIGQCYFWVVVFC